MFTQFNVRVIDAVSARVHSTLVHAASAEAAAALVAANGEVVLSVEPVGRPPGTGGDDRVQKRTGGGRSAAAGRRTPGGRGWAVDWWCRELRLLLLAGMTVVEALETLGGATGAGPRARVSWALWQRIERGDALSKAMDDEGGFPAVLVAGVRAAERTGALVGALDDFLRYHDQVDALKRKAVSAAIYPAIVVGLGAVITLFLLLYVMPRFASMYATLDGPMSWGTKLALNVSGAAALGAPWLVATIATLSAVLWMAVRSKRFVHYVDAGLQRMGWLQRRLDHFRLAKLYHSLDVMFKGGITIDDALSHSASLGLGPRVQTGCMAAHAALLEGRSVSAAMHEGRLVDSISHRLLAVGERTGNFDRVLGAIAQRHAQEFATLIERLSRILEPVLLLAVALLVGGLVVLMYLPIFDMASNLG